MDGTPQSSSERRADLRRILRTVVRTIRLSWEASRSQFLILALIVVVSAILPPIVVLISRRLIDQIAVGAALRAILPIAVGLGVLTVFQRIISLIEINHTRLFSFEVRRHTENLFLTKTAQTELANFDDPGWHDRVQHVARESNQRPQALTNATIGLTGSAITLLGMMGVLLTLHPLLLFLAPIAVLVPLPFQRQVNRSLFRFWASLTTREREQLYLRFLLSGTGPAKDLRAYTLEGELLRRHEAIAEERQRRFRTIHFAADKVEALSTAFGGLALIAAFAFVAVRGAGGSLTPGDVTALIGAVTSVTATMTRVFTSLILIDESAPFLDDFFSFLDIEPTVEIPSDPVALPVPLQGGIEFDNVGFTYPGQEGPALQGLTLRIDDGEMIALVGDNGAGKTTMIKLLQRFYDPTAGAIRVGGVDLRDADPLDIRGRMGVLFQDYTNFTMRVRDAVAMGRVERDATDQEIWDALERARAADIVRGMPHQLDSFLGRVFEGGKEPSGGEWQRLALARLLFRDADVWILDEPTSSLDPEAEAAIFSRLREQLADRIGIIISHRFSTVRIADRIAVVDDGRVSELGTHEELVAAGGRYAQLFELQASAYR